MSIENGLENSLDYSCKTCVVRIEENISHEYLMGKLIPDWLCLTAKILYCENELRCNKNASLI